jgi:hypothetical protein
LAQHAQWASRETNTPWESERGALDKNRSPSTRASPRRPAPEWRCRGGRARNRKHTVERSHRVCRQCFVPQWVRAAFNKQTKSGENNQQTNIVSLAAHSCARGELPNERASEATHGLPSAKRTGPPRSPALRRRATPTPARRHRSPRCPLSASPCFLCLRRPLRRRRGR